MLEDREGRLLIPCIRYLNTNKMDLRTPSGGSMRTGSGKPQRTAVRGPHTHPAWQPGSLSLLQSVWELAFVPSEGFSFKGSGKKRKQLFPEERVVVKCTVRCLSL